jgi:hypothetical protein
MQRLPLLAIALFSLAVAGCAVGNRYAYHTIVADPTLTGTAAVSVGTHDQREYVRAGSKDPRFVGLQRGGFGNPFDVKTEDDKPLADGMTNAVVSTLVKKGFRAQGVVVAHSVSAEEARQRLSRAGGERALLLTLREWKSDAAIRIRLSYELSLQVLDRSGALLAEKRVEGTDVLGAAGLPSGVGEIVGRAFKAKIEELLDDPGVAAALRGGA